MLHALLGLLVSGVLFCFAGTVRAELLTGENILRHGDFITFPAMLSKKSAVEMMVHCEKNVGYVLFSILPKRMYANNSKLWAPPVALPSKQVKEIKSALSRTDEICKPSRRPAWRQIDYPVHDLRVAIDVANLVRDKEMAYVWVMVDMPKIAFDPTNKAPYKQMRQLMGFDCKKRLKVPGASRYFLDQKNIVTLVTYAKNSVKNRTVDVRGDAPILEAVCAPGKLKALRALNMK